MRHLFFLATIFLLLTGSMAVLAQDTKPQADPSLYTVTDVAADVTADNAAHARDQAVAKAQRTAFEQLVDRLGAPADVSKKLSDDDISTLVKSFEVQDEHRSAVRYIGTFTVEFKPNAVKTYFGNHNAQYSEDKSDPVLVLPVVVNGTQTVLWEDKTKWRTAWENSAAKGGLVPVVVPVGGLDDIAIISTAEAVKAKTPSIKAIINKYQTHGAVVAILSGDLDKPAGVLKIDITHYDADGDTRGTAQFTVTATTGFDAALTQAVQQVRRQMEKDWKQEARDPHPAKEESEDSPVSVASELPAAKASIPKEPIQHLPVTVAISSLAEWAQIERKLQSIPAIVRVDVIMLQRGSTSIEIDFHGSVDALLLGLNQQGLILHRDPMNNGWILAPTQIGGY